MVSLKHRLGITALVSAIEDTGLVLWLALLHVNPAITGALLSLITLFTFLTSEHLITQRDAAGRLTLHSILEVLGFTSLEVVDWAVWLLLIPVNGAAAAGYFLSSFFLEHQLTYNTKRGLPFISIKDSNDVAKGVIVETVSEFVGAALWIVLGPSAGIIPLVIGSNIEHFVASGQ